MYIVYSSICTQVVATRTDPTHERSRRYPGALIKVICRRKKININRMFPKLANDRWKEVNI